MIFWFSLQYPSPVVGGWNSTLLAHLELHLFITVPIPGCRGLKLWFQTYLVAGFPVLQYPSPVVGGWNYKIEFITQNYDRITVPIPGCRGLKLYPAHINPTIITIRITVPIPGCRGLKLCFSREQVIFSLNLLQYPSPVVGGWNPVCFQVSSLEELFFHYSTHPRL